jgi:PDZ domain-containing secreted protein
MRKRNIWLEVGAALIIVAGIQGYLARNYLIIGPGPVQKLEEMVTVETGNKDAQGAFLLTAVTSAPAGIPSWIAALISPYTKCQACPNIDYRSYAAHLENTIY